MRNALLFATAFALFACRDIAPTENIDLCEGDDPPSNSCDQCKSPPFAKECPKCKHQPPEPGCENADNTGSGGASGGDGGNGGTSGSGGNIGTGGSSGTGGEDGGSGGTLAMTDAGPDAAIDGGHACSGCAAGWNLCVGTECAQCLKEGDCGDQFHCDKLGTHACVQCINDSHCEAAGMVCDEDQHTCVPCVVDTDCKDPKLPQCNNNVCSPCSDQDACEGRDGFGHCDKGTGSATKGQCVECLAHGDCENPKTPQCNSKHECEKCSGDDACVDREGTTVCDADQWSESSGKCVECTGTKYAACKVGATEYVCDSLKRQCSNKAIVHTGDACMPCVSDAQCQSGRVCVKQTFDDPTDSPDQGAIDVGYFCAWGLGSGNGPNGDCFNEAPFVHQIDDAATIEHNEADVCVLRVSTCTAFNHFSDEDCATSGTPDDNACGDPNAPHDGYCVMAGPTTYRCSMPCGGSDDCKTGFGCNTAANPDVCSL